MSLILQASLLFAMAPVAPPPTEVVITRPDLSLPRLRRFLDWASLARPDLSPQRIQQAGADIELDLLDVKSLEAYGVDPKKPLDLNFDGNNRCLLLELTLASPKAARAKMEKLVEGAPPGLGVQTIGSSAVLVDSGGPWSVALVLEGRRLLVQLPEPRGLSFFSPPGAERGPPDASKTKVKAWHEHPSLIPLVRLKSAHRLPTAFSVRGRPAPDVLFRTSAAPDLPPSRGQAWLEDDGFELRVRWAMGLGQELAASELVPARGGARALFDAAKLSPAIEFRFELARAATALIGRRFGLPEAASAAFRGPAHLVFTSSGDVIAAFSIDGRVDASVSKVVQEAVARRYPAAQARIVEHDKKKLLAVWLGRTDEREIVSALLAEPAPASASYLHLEASPERVPAALEARSRAGDGLGLPGVQLMFFRLVLKPLLAATGPVQVDLWPRKGEAELGAKVAYRTQGLPR